MSPRTRLDVDALPAWAGRMNPEVLYLWRRLAALDREIGDAVALVLERRHATRPRQAEEVGYECEE